jgi:RNA polymerase sigma-70 factor, ECF subfamily
MQNDGNITQLLIQYGKGDADALQNLLPAVYQELRKLAQSYMRKESASHTLQPTALVHEAYFKLVDQKSVAWQNRSHFFGIAAQAMRRILIDHARVKHAEKRGGDHTRVSFEEQFHSNSPSGEPDLLALNDALEKLTALDERQGKVVELRYFGGLGIEEIAEVLQTSPATVKRDWTMAKAWLSRELSAGDVDGNKGS